MPPGLPARGAAAPVSNRRRPSPWARSRPTRRRVAPRSGIMARLRGLSRRRPGTRGRRTA
eukprot:2512105-Alexandrium_andersonii.AAC.1